MRKLRFRRLSYFPVAIAKKLEFTPRSISSDSKLGLVIPKVPTTATQKNEREATTTHSTKGPARHLCHQKRAVRGISWLDGRVNPGPLVKAASSKAHIPSARQKSNS